jgi:hypothetical protein
MSNYQVNVYEDGKIVGRVAYRQTWICGTAGIGAGGKGYTWA